MPSRCPAGPGPFVVRMTSPPAHETRRARSLSPHDRQLDRWFQPRLGSLVPCTGGGRHSQRVKASGGEEPQHVGKVTAYEVTHCCLPKLCAVRSTTCAVAGGVVLSSTWR